MTLLLKARVLGWELGEIKQIRAGNREELQTNPHLASYVQLLNLQSLFEFCIPCIQDYGAALKGQEWHIFLDCYLRMLVFYLGCSSKDACRNSFMTLLVRSW